MVLASRLFGKHISDLKVDGDIWKRYNFSIHDFSNRITTHFNMLGTLIENRIDNKLNSTCVVSMKRSSSSIEKSNFCKEPTKPNNLWVSSRHGFILKT